MEVLLNGVEPSRAPLDPSYEEEDKGLVARAEGWYDDKAKQARESHRCIFCNLKEEFVIAHYHGWTMTTNFFPRSKANLLVLPDAHKESITELNEQDAIARLRLEQLGYSLVQESFGIKAVHFTLREGGGDKTVDHLHSHVMHYYHGIMKWYNEQNMPERVFRTPEEIGQPLLQRVVVARTLQEALAKRLEVTA
jgi:diadenosine tetraphosphate (Ap4A) HIT family hydrolase